MRATQRTPKQDRVFLRVTGEQKELLQAAAELEGVTVSAFMTRVLLREAAEVVREHAVLRLSPRDSLRLAQALLDPPEPNEALRAAFERHAELVESRD